MAQEVLLYLSLIIVVAAIITVLTRIIKQPPIIGYIIAGILVGPLFLNFIGPTSASNELVSTFAHIGVSLLLFIVGLNLDFRLLKEIGKVSTLVGLVQIILTALFGFFISKALIYDNISSLYIALALAFSSTVVVVKIFSDKKEIDTLHGRISLGILLIQDIIAAIALMALPLIANEGDATSILQNLGLVIILIAIVFTISSLFLKRMFNFLAQNQEVLFLFGIAWALAISSLFDYLGFSAEIGALIAGVSLASTKYTLELGGKIKPLRDFFVVLFFVFFGSQLNGIITSELIKNALILSILVLLGKPIIVMITLKFSGYKKRINFLTATSLAQISEFSLILALLGYKLGQLNQEIMSLVILVSIFTIGISSYGIYYSHRIFDKISNWLNLFEGDKFGLDSKKEKTYDIILFGYHRMGYKVLNALNGMHKSFLVVDFNPKVIISLNEKKIEALYGDAGDKNFLSDIPLDKAKIIISTVPDEQANLAIREMLKETKSDAIFIANAEQPRIALDLYKQGIDYVVIPHHLGGEYLKDMILEFKTKKERYKQKGKEHYKALQKGKNHSSFV